MTTDFNRILVPALTAKFGKWRYYQIIINIEDLVKNYGSEASPNYRVKSVEEVEEIYSKKGVNNLLQRAFDPRRLEPIKNYILKQPDRYINNLTLAIFGGDPNWLDISISKDPKIEIGSDFIAKKRVGFIELKGTETIFVLDGQHRLKGLRKAYQENPGKIMGEQIACTLIIHSSDEEGRIRTRRLFSTVNRQAKPVSAGENYLLDEDDASAIIVRDLIEQYKYFKNNEVIALSKSGNINKSDYDKFSTVVTLYEINERLIDHSKIYPEVNGKLVRIRPSDDDLLSQKRRVFRYWDKVFDLVPSAIKFINDKRENRRKYREGGGNYILRPIAQLALFEILLSFEKENRSPELIRELPLEVSNKFWQNILWDPYKNVMLFNRSYVRNYLKYNFGLKLVNSELNRLKEGYEKNSGDLKLSLPRPRFI